MVSMLDDIKKDIVKKNQQLFEDLEVFKQSQSDRFEDICEEVLAKRFKKYDKVMHDFGKFFDQEELAIQMANKADILTINDININKASK